MGLYRSDQFDYHELGSGVWAAIAKPASGALGNSGIVDTGRSALVFDTSMTPRAARDLRAAARLLSGKEPLEVVNSHWHLDHTMGNKIFGGCTIRSTLLTQNLLATNGAALVARVHDPSWGRVATELETRRDAGGQGPAYEELVQAAATARDLWDSRESVEIRLPDEVFSGRHFYPGGRDLMIVEGAGHSESDTALFVPESEVMFTGDLVVVETHPDFRSANIARWLEALERIEKATPKTIVPGHGPVSDVASCGQLRSYFRAVREVAADSGPVKIPPEFEGWGKPSLFQSNIALLRQGGGASSSEG